MDWQHKLRNAYPKRLRPEVLSIYKDYRINDSFMCAHTVTTIPSHEVKNGIFHLWCHTSTQTVSDSETFMNWLRNVQLVSMNHSV